MKPQFEIFFLIQRTLSSIQIVPKGSIPRLAAGYNEKGTGIEIKHLSWTGYVFCWFFRFKQGILHIWTQFPKEAEWRWSFIKFYNSQKFLHIIYIWTMWQ